jgi:hypothetical protein
MQARHLTGRHVELHSMMPHQHGAKQQVLQ